MKKYKLRAGVQRHDLIGGKLLTHKRAIELSDEEAKQFGTDIVVAKKDDGIEEGLILTKQQKGVLKERKMQEKRAEEAAAREKAKEEKKRANAKRMVLKGKKVNKKDNLKKE